MYLNSLIIHLNSGSKRKSKGMATEQDVHEAGGQKCIQQNLNIAFVFFKLSKNTPSNQQIAKNIIEFVKGIRRIFKRRISQIKLR